MSLPHRGAWVAIIATVVALCVDTLPVEHLVASQHSLFAAGDVNANAFHEIPADVAVVLGYSLDHGVPTRPLEARVRLGVRLFCSGRARNILFSGAEGENAGVLLTEAFAMASLAKTLLLMNHSLGDFDGKRGRCAPPLEKHPRRVAPHELGRRAVKDNRGHPVRVRELSVHDGSLETQTVQREGKFVWVLEESSTSTRENAVFSLQECRRRGWRKVLVVTNRFHQSRAVRAFRNAAREAAARDAESAGEFEIGAAEMPLALERAAQFPPPGSGFRTRGKELCRAQWNVLRETAACALYWYRGWI